MTNQTKQEVLLSALMKLSDQFQSTMKWSDKATEEDKSLVIGNLNGFCGFLSQSVMPEDFLNQPVDVKATPAAKDATDARVRIEQLVAEVSELQRDHYNLVTKVYFRAGLLMARETLARFVEAESPTIAQSIRLNWWPSLGQDPGPPRLFNYDEIAEEQPNGFIAHKDVSPQFEALALAYQIMNQPTASDTATK